MSEKPAQVDEAEAVANSAEESLGYSRYVLVILFLVYIFNFIDRQILSVLLDPIKEDLGATDTQMGFLTGFAFAVFYTGFGIPIARWADTGVRRSIIAMGLTVWSVMTAACGFAQNFVQLAIARVGVGVGEAAGSPPAHSLISDYFPPHKRASAMSFYNIGIPVGVMLGYLAGGWIVEFFNWRVAFFVVGFPGVVLALVLRFTVREPPRGMSEGRAIDTTSDSVRDVARFLLSLRSFVLLAVASGMSAFSAYGFGSWVPAFLGRVHGMGYGEIGTWIGLENGIGGAIGMIATGLLADRLGRRDPRWYLWISALSIALYLPFSVAFLLLENSTPALLAYFVPITLGTVYLGPMIALTHQLVKVRMRAVASSVLLFFLNLIGMGLGPQAVGIFNDLLAPSYGVEAIRWSLLAVLTSKFVAIALYLLAAKYVVQDLKAKDGFREAAIAANSSSLRIEVRLYFRAMSARATQSRWFFPVPVVFAVLSLVWGSTWLVVRLSVESTPPLLALGLRFALAGAILYFIARLRGVPLGGRSHERRLWWIQASLNYFGSYLLVYLGETQLSSGLAAVLYAVFPLAVGVSGHFMLDQEKLGSSAVLGMIIALAGVGLLTASAGSGHGAGSFSWLGVAMMVGAPFVAAIAQTLVKRDGIGISALSLTSIPMLLAGVAAILLSLLVEQPGLGAVAPYAVLAIVYLAVVGTALPFLSYYWLLERLPSRRLSTMSFVIPVVAVALGVVVLSEPFTTTMTLGAAIILVGTLVSEGALGRARWHWPATDVFVGGPMRGRFARRPAYSRRS